MCCAVFPSLCPRSANCTGLSSSAILRQSAGHSCPIPQIIYTHCTSPTIFCFQKQKSLLAASKLSGAIILNVHVKSECRQRAPADAQPPPAQTETDTYCTSEKTVPPAQAKTCDHDHVPGSRGCMAAEWHPRHMAHLCTPGGRAHAVWFLTERILTSPSDVAPTHGLRLVHHANHRRHAARQQIPALAIFPPSSQVFKKSSLAITANKTTISFNTHTSS